MAIMDKPHLSFARGRWLCRGRQLRAWGSNPWTAYSQWAKWHKFQYGWNPIERASTPGETE